VRFYVGWQRPKFTFVRKASVEMMVHERGVDLGAVCELVIKDGVAVDDLPEAPSHCFTYDIAVPFYRRAR
jgi:hypothetical protein